MSQSLTKNFVHIVFSTKYRQNFIYPPFELPLYKYLAGLCNEFNCQPIKVGGHLDHVHILCDLAKVISLAKLLELIKCNSSKWMKTQDFSLRDFYWQNGYAAFSVNPSGINQVIQYIENQKFHHQKVDFQDEMRLLMPINLIEIDEQYFWD